MDVNSPQLSPQLSDEQRRLIFRAWHRGTREMDLLMGNFADRYVPHMNEADLVEFADILQEPDPDLYDWIAGRKTAPANIHGRVFQQFLAFKLHEAKAQ